MSSSLVGLVHVLSVALAASIPAAPIEWSRDSAWIAYTTVESSDAPVLASGWMLTPEEETSALPSDPATPLRTYRIWATRVKGGESVLIEESQHPLSSPAWAADGRTLIYGRFVPTEGGNGSTQHGRYEVVVRTGLDRMRTVPVATDLELDADDEAAIVRQKPAPSPDGRRAAVPKPGSSHGLWLVYVAEERPPLALEGAFSPAWSPDGRRLAFLKDREEGAARPTDPAVLVHLLTPATGSDRVLSIKAPTLSGSLLAWSQDGQSLLMIAGPGGGAFRSRQATLVRIGLDGGYPIPASTLESLPANIPGRMRSDPAALDGDARPRSIRVDLTMDAEQDQGVCLIDVDGQDQVMRWCSLVSQNTYDRFHPLDAGLRIGAPAIAPDGLTLAFRVDDGGGAGLPALFDLTSKETTALAPDAATRRRWLDRLASCAVDLLRTWLSSPVGEGGGARPTVLPIMGELGGFHPRQFRLKRLAKFAAAPLASAPAAADDELDEFRLFFAYLGQDYAEAERLLPAVESKAETPLDRLRWTCLRAQILMSKGEAGRASGIVNYLNRTSNGSRLLIEETAGGYALAPVADPARTWARHLETKAVDGTLLRTGTTSNDLANLSDAPDAVNLGGGLLPDPNQMPHAPFAPNPGLLPVPPDEFGAVPLRRRFPNLNDPPPAPPLGPPPAEPITPPAPGLRVLPLEFEP